jgi:hypothetical protein
VRNHTKSLAALFVAAFAVTFLAFQPTSAAGAGPSITLCNKGSQTKRAFDLLYAVGYYSPGVNDPPDHSVLSGPFVSRGWFLAKENTCVTIDNPFGARYIFYWAYEGNFSYANTQYSPDPKDPSVFTVANPWTTTGNDHFCITEPFVGTPKAFTYEDENGSAEACRHKNLALEDQQCAQKRIAESTATCYQNMWVPVRKVDTSVDRTINYAGE